MTTVRSILIVAAVCLGLVGCSAAMDPDPQRQAVLDSVMQQLDSVRATHRDGGDVEAAMAQIHPDLPRRGGCWGDFDDGDLVCVTCCFQLFDEVTCCVSCEDGGGCG